MSRPDVLCLYPLRPDHQAELERTYRVHRFDLSADRPAMLGEAGPLCESIVTNGHAGLDRATVERLPRLKLVACSSAGFETIDTDALRERGIVLTNTSVALLDDVADMAILLMLAAWRRLVPADRYVRSGDWGRKGMFPLQRSLRARRLGIVGMGTIGQAIARRAEPMGLEIAFTARSPKPRLPWRFEPSLLGLAEASDILIVIIAGGEGTRGLVSAEVIEALGPQGCLVNVSRGSVVDEPALIAALRDGRLGSAGLDVFASEPDCDPAFAALDNVVLHPHHASGTIETRDAMAQLVLDNLAAHYQGRPLLTPVW